MGNADLRDLAAIRDISLCGDRGKRRRADAHNWLYRYHHDDGEVDG